MGYEAYKIAAKIRNLSKDGMIGALRRHGAVPVETFGGTATMEITGAGGVIELIVRAEDHVNLRFAPEDKVLLTIRFSKTSRAQTAGDVLSLLRKLAAEFEFVYIRDCQTNRDINPADAAWLYQAVAYAKNDFDYHIPVRRSAVRCRDVFCPEQRSLTAAAAAL